MSSNQYASPEDLHHTLQAATELARQLTAFLENPAHGSPKDPATGIKLFTDGEDGAEQEIADALLAARNAMWMVTGAITGVLGLTGGGQFGTRPARPGHQHMTAVPPDQAGPRVSDAR